MAMTSFSGWNSCRGSVGSSSNSSSDSSSSRTRRRIVVTGHSTYMGITGSNPAQANDITHLVVPL